MQRHKKAIYSGALRKHRALPVKKQLSIPKPLGGQTEWD